MDFSVLRAYLGEPVRTAARLVMLDALVYLIPGAVLLLEFLLQMRMNRRTRRSFADAAAAFAMATPPRWIAVLTKQMWNMYRLCLRQEYHSFFIMFNNS
jgi:cytochrome c-type biogenesis protein CcmH/NrfF